MQSKEKEAGPEPIEVAVRSWLAGIRVSAATKETYARAIKPFAGFLEAGGIGLEDARRRDVERYVDGLMEDGLEPANAALYLAAVKSLYSFLSELGCRNPAAGVRGPKMSRMFKRDSLTRDQVSELLSSMRRETPIQKRNFAMVNLMVRTGLRDVEVVRADIRDIRTRMGADVLYVQGKGRPGKDSFVVLTPAAMGPISEYLVTRSCARPGDPLFASRRADCGGRMSTRTVSRVAKDSMRRVGIDDRWHTAHSLRHTAVTLALLGGAGERDAQMMARHADVSTTMIYAHDIDRIANAAEKSVDAYLSQ